MILNKYAIDYGDSKFTVQVDDELAVDPETGLTAQFKVDPGVIPTITVYKTKLYELSLANAVSHAVHCQILNVGSFKKYEPTTCEVLLRPVLNIASKLTTDLLGILDENNLKVIRKKQYEQITDR